MKKVKPVQEAEHAGVYDMLHRKKENILKNIRATRLGQEDVTESPAYQEALKLYNEYIESHQMKHTPERIFILKKLYECQTPVDSKTLYDMVCKEEGLVSKATIYNNLALLIEAKLIRKLDLVGGNMFFYEKTVGQTPHGYIICDKCGSISLLNDPELFAKDYKLPRGFLPDGITFHIHGTCHKCHLAERRNEKKLEQKIQKKTKLKS